MVVVHVVLTAGVAVVFSGGVAADIVDEVSLDNDVGVAQEDAVAAHGRIGAVSAHVMDMVPDDLDVVPSAVVVKGGVAESPHLKAFDADIVGTAPELPA